MGAAEVVHGLPFAEYQAIAEVHATALRLMLVSPLAYRRAQEQPRDETDAMRLGRAVHTACLEPLSFMREYVLWEGGRRFGKEWDRFTIEHKGKTILTGAQYDTATKIQSAVRGHVIASRYLNEPGNAELSIRWVHARTGVKIKCRLDYLCSVVLDLKTCRDPSPAKFATAAGQYGYAMQLALYRDAAAAAGLGALPGKIIAAQSVEPYDVAVYDVGDELHHIGVEQYEKALEKLVECTKSNSWPGMAPSEELSLRLPAWAVPESDEEPIMFGDQAL